MPSGTFIYSNGRSGGGNSSRQREWLADTMAPKTSSSLISPKSLANISYIEGAGH